MSESWRVCDGKLPRTPLRNSLLYRGEADPEFVLVAAEKVIGPSWPLLMIAEGEADCNNRLTPRVDCSLGSVWQSPGRSTGTRVQLTCAPTAITLHLRYLCIIGRDDTSLTASLQYKGRRTTPPLDCRSLQFYHLHLDFTIKNFL